MGLQIRGRSWNCLPLLNLLPCDSGSKLRALQTLRDCRRAAAARSPSRNTGRRTFEDENENEDEEDGMAVLGDWQQGIRALTDGGRRAAASRSLLYNFRSRKKAFPVFDTVTETAPPA